MGKISDLLSIIIFGCTILLIVVGTFKKVYDEHIEKEYLVIEKYIQENAKRCFLEDICEGNKTTVKFLIENKYISSKVDPVTKEYIDENTVITFENNECLLKLK